MPYVNQDTKETQAREIRVISPAASNRLNSGYLHTCTLIRGLCGIWRAEIVGIAGEPRSTVKDGQKLKRNDTIDGTMEQDVCV